MTYFPRLGQCSAMTLSDLLAIRQRRTSARQFRLGDSEGFHPARWTRGCPRHSAALVCRSRGHGGCGRRKPGNLSHESRALFPRQQREGRPAVDPVDCDHPKRIVPRSSLLVWRDALAEAAPSRRSDLHHREEPVDQPKGALDSPTPRCKRDTPDLRRTTRQTGSFLEPLPERLARQPVPLIRRGAASRMLARHREERKACRSRHFHRSQLVLDTAPQRPRPPAPGFADWAWQILGWWRQHTRVGERSRQSLT